MSQDAWHKKAFYRISAYGVIRNKNNEILMVNEHNYFTLPGGGWDYGETLHDALKRELDEEIALASDFREKIIDAAPFFNESKNAWQMLLLCDIMYDDLEFSVGEHAGATKWCRLDEIDLSAPSNRLVVDLLTKQNGV